LLPLSSTETNLRACGYVTAFSCKELSGYAGYAWTLT